MTALTASHAVVRTTGFERMLLTTAAGLDRFVATRLERRGTTEGPRAAQTAAGEIRSDALAMGAVGMLPR
ncbi:hypothetical protein MK786_01550 [Microbacterium sp. CFH 31415]|uniref:hypothetical protein n=1 Tax=Microbacterium sp. CFH 31415 TaxID=2921732 RepID=UPI001F148DD8|nr:hypothetical protein [Microbacterium sp. CFH 31415]MCH6229420.1 hypothetical protein [Microbacterium sp. CFH 31415]